MTNRIVSMKKNEAPIVVEQLYDASLETIWAAITEPRQMIQWFFKEIPEFKPEVGFETNFNVRVEDRDYPHFWKVTEVVSREKISYHWRFGGHEGEAFSTFELFPRNGKSGLRLTFKVLEDFPDGIIEFARESGEQGWSYFIQNSLKDYLMR